MKMQCSANSVTVNTYHAIQPKCYARILMGCQRELVWRHVIPAIWLDLQKMRVLAAEKCSRTQGRNRWAEAFFQAMWWLDGVGATAGRGVRAALYRVQYFTR